MHNLLHWGDHYRLPRTRGRSGLSYADAHGLVLHADIADSRRRRIERRGCTQAHRVLLHTKARCSSDRLQPIFSLWHCTHSRHDLGVGHHCLVGASVGSPLLVSRSHSGPRGYGVVGVISTHVNSLRRYGQTIEGRTNHGRRNSN